MTTRILIILQETDIETLAIEELMIARSQLKTIDSDYQEMNLTTPEWTIDRLQEVSNEITLRVKSELQRQLRTELARRSALRTRDERRGDSDKKIERLRKQLG